MPAPRTEAETAAALLDLWGSGRQSADLAVPDMAAARRIAGRIRDARLAQGDGVAGRKIGFSNTRIWPVYGVDRPIWGHVWSSTRLVGPDPLVDLTGLPEPRIEPEVVLSLSRAPEAGMDDAVLLGCIDAVAAGFEIVQSVYPGWKVTAPGAAAAFGLHGRLITGPWQPIAADRAGWGARLQAFGVTLCKGGVAVETGHARNVLGGPVQALRHLVQALASEADPEPLRAGELVSTGTLTDAHPVAPGQHWSARFDGIALPDLHLRCA
jgi:2-oxo-3-hexenedioate decarboxylase